MYATWIFWIGWINIHKWKSLSIESNPISTKISLCILYNALYAPCSMLMLKYASLVILFKLLNVNASNWIVYWTLCGGISQNSQIMNKLSLFNQSCFGVQTHIKRFESRYFKETHSSFGSFFVVVVVNKSNNCLGLTSLRFSRKLLGKSEILIYWLNYCVINHTEAKWGKFLSK